MLDRADGRALGIAQHGAQARIDNLVPLGWNHILPFRQIGADENDAAIGRRGQQAQCDRRAGMDTNARALRAAEKGALQLKGDRRHSCGLSAGREANEAGRLRQRGPLSAEIGWVEANRELEGATTTDVRPNQQKNQMLKNRNTPAYRNCKIKLRYGMLR